MSYPAVAPQPVRDKCPCGEPAAVALDTRDRWAIPALDVIAYRSHASCAREDHLASVMFELGCEGRYVVGARPCVGV